VAQGLGGLRRAYTVRYLDFESGQVSELFREEGPSLRRSLDVSPGEEWIIHGERPPLQSELILVENLR